MDTGSEQMTREQIAIHEAGHAVASVLLGLRFTRVTLVPHGEALASTGPYPDAPDEYDKGWEEWMGRKCVASLAGHEAERRVSDPEQFGVGTVIDDDWYDVGDFAFSLTGPDGDEEMGVLINRWLSEARVLLARNWSMVERVADELLGRGTLSGWDVAVILDAQDASADRGPPGTRGDVTLTPDVL